MILYHPLSNKSAIDKYKDREVYVYHKQFGLWLTNNPSSWWQIKDNRKSINFKQALKLTKHYKPESKIEYHFIDDIGEEKLKITDFDQESIINCTSISFDKYSYQTTKNHFSNAD
jgi:hypothetical protein